MGLRGGAGGVVPELILVKYSSGRVIRTHGAEAQPQVLRWFFVGWAASLRFLSGGVLPKNQNSR